MEYDKFKLFIPAPDKQTRQDCASTGSVVQSNICSILTVVQKNFPKMEIEVFDGEIEGDSELKKKIQQVDSNTIVAISCKVINFENAKALASISKQAGAFTIAGGAYPSSRGLYIQEKEIIPFVAKDILRFCKDFDVSIFGEGEYAIVDLINALNATGTKDLRKIPNICYRENGEILQNGESLISLNNIPIPDRRFLQKYFPSYSENLRKGFKYFPDYKPKLKVTFWSQLGCPKGIIQDKGRCIYCSLHFQKIRKKDTKKVWEEIRLISNLLDGEPVMVWDVCDDITGNLNRLHKMVETKPPYFTPYLRVYSRPDGINEKTVSIFRKIGVREVFLGVESMNDRVLRKAGKKTNSHANYEAIKWLSKYGIITNMGMVFGLEEETEESLNQNLNFIKYCSSVTDFQYYFHLTAAVPYRGSRIFNFLYLNKDVGHKYQSAELRNNPRLALLEGIKDWNRLKSRVPLSHIDRIIDEGFKYSPIRVCMYRVPGYYNS